MLQHVILFHSDWRNVCQTLTLTPYLLSQCPTVNIPSDGATSEVTDTEDVILAPPQSGELGLIWRSVHPISTNILQRPSSANARWTLKGQLTNLIHCSEGPQIMWTTDCGDNGRRNTRY